MLVAVLALAAPALAQRDPWAGSWRGVLTTPQCDDIHVTGEVFGDLYEETRTIGFDADLRSIVWQWHEQLSTGQQLVGLGNWTSPIAITFLTVPVEAAGSVSVLKRLMSMTSDTSFSVTGQFSVDGGPFRRLGNGSYF